jgi:exopolysaccharide biosynthesis polyprenyl glycosylphosphotransferase
MLPLANTRRIWMVAVLPVIDFLSVLFGAGLVYLVRYRWFAQASLFSDQNLVQRDPYIYLAIIFSIAVTVMFAYFGLYDVRSRLTIWQTLTRIISGIFYVLLAVIAFYFFIEYRDEYLPAGINLSRFILAMGGFFILYTVLFTRFVLWIGLQIAYFLGFGKVDVLVVANHETELESWLRKRHDIREVFVVRELNRKSTDEVLALLATMKISEVYLYSNQNPLESELALYSERYKIPFVFRPLGFGQYSAFDLYPVVIGKHHMIEISHSLLNGWWVVLKRVFDVLFSLLFLMVFGWLYVLIIAAIYIEDKGAPFYLNERIGPNGQTFRLWKFRRFKPEFCTTSKNAEALDIERELIEQQNLKSDNGPLYKIKNDPRMTKMGRILERTSLDELPQFINVLLGSMSVVGPRPHQPREVAKYESHHYKVLNIKPGITGLAQINGRSDLNFEQEVFFDTYYIEHWSFWLDIYIILRTPYILIFKPHKA